MRQLSVSVFLVCCGAGGWTPAHAQSTSDSWSVVVAPYGMAAGMSGTTAVRGFEADVNVSASDIFSNLQFGAMGVIAATKGNWGFGSDLVWTALGTTIQNTNVDVNQGAFAFYGMRRLGPAASFTFGMRINTLQQTLTFKGPGIERSQDKTWVDPIVGVMLRRPGDRRLLLRLYTEIGGFGAGSDFTWQLFPQLGIRLTEHASFELGYRWLDVDYNTGEGTEQFKYDMLTQGPAVGFAFRF